MRLTARWRPFMIICLVAIGALALTIWLSELAADPRHTLVRVGGEINPCRCTHRIEP